jgi:predicted enzyme related to lactoylglutathione lyase
MRIKLTSVIVDDQEKALKFYTEKLGFVKKVDMPAGPMRWLTVGSADSDGISLLLEPNANPAGKAFQEALYTQGIPATIFDSADVRSEYEKLKDLGVVFVVPPTTMGPVLFAMFDDTCGNILQIAQKAE